VGIAVLLVGTIFRMLATGGELWLDELWSLLHVSTITNPTEIFTKVRHDNNHLLNSLWMWICLWVGSPTPLAVRIPSLLCGVIILYLLFTQIRSEERTTNTVWLALVAFSYPLTLYGTEARGYSLTLLCALVSYLSLVRLLRDPYDGKAIIAFGMCGVVGSLSHAIYVLFLAPALMWVLWQVVTSRLKDNSRYLIRYGMVPPILTSLVLTLTFYKGMEIGGAPLLPYLEVAATTTSVAFGGVALSSINAEATGWSLFLAISIVTVCIIEIIAWMRSGDPRALLVTLILLTPWVAVATFQPHFILPRYFIIQLLFAYLVAARFLVRLMQQGRFGSLVCAVLMIAYLAGNLLHTYQLIERGRSHFVEIFTTLKNTAGTVTVGGDQDFQNSLRLAYAGFSANELSYINSYRTSTTAPRFIIRESIDAYEEFPETFSTSQAHSYHKVRTLRAPLLNGSNVYMYEIVP
jgi:uncharacterized membrane protein